LFSFFIVRKIKNICDTVRFLFLRSLIFHSVFTSQQNRTTFINNFSVIISLTELHSFCHHQNILIVYLFFLDASEDMMINTKAYMQSISFSVRICGSYLYI
jgi:hypothetical protein